MQNLSDSFNFQCNRCKPLYNNKPFQRGDQDDSYPCVKCECNEHASSCVYNQSLDTSPNSRTQGGGGVCIDCQHNTTGRFCEVCKERFYRESGKILKSPDVCTPCACEVPGVQSGKLDCVKVSALLRSLLLFPRDKGVCMCVYVIGHSPSGLFRTNVN